MPTFIACTKIENNSGASANASVSATAGNALLCAANEYQSGTTLTVSGGGTWTTDGVSSASPAGGMRQGFASCPSATGGTNTVTVTFSAGGGTTAFILEFSGMATSGILDAIGTGKTTTSSTPNTNSLTNVSASAVFLASTCSDTGATYTYSTTSTGWILPTNGAENSSTFLVAACAYKIVATSASDAAAWANGGFSDEWNADIVSYVSTSTTNNTRTATPVTVALIQTSTRTATPVTVAAQFPGQHGTTIADVSIGNWTTNSGGTSSLYATLDETPADDTDYVQSRLNPQNTDQLTMDLTQLSTPVSGTRTLSYRYSKDTGTERIDLQVELLQGTTVVQSWTHTDIPTAWTQADQTVTGSITNYADLHIRLTASQP